MKHRRVLLIADLQIDEDVATSLPGTHPGLTRRLADRIVCWGWAVSVAKEAKCSLIAVLGDVFDDRHSVTLSCLYAFTQMLKMARKHGIEVVALPGNHDAALRHVAINSVAPFDGLATVIDTPSTFDGMAVVPWAEPVEYVQSLRPFRGKCDVLLSHVLTTGVVKGAKGVSPSVFDGFDRVFLGDVHDPDERYVGSWMQLDYRDAGKRRGVVVYDRKTRKATYHENTVSPRFHLFDTVEAAEDGVGEVREIDHVRCTVPVPDALFAKLRKRAATVEAPPSVTAEVVRRSGIRADMSDRVLLKRYLRSVGRYSASRLKSGLEILTH